MNGMTPKTLEAQLRGLQFNCGQSGHDLYDVVRAHAAAWEADLFKRWQTEQVVIAKNARIEELEKERDAWKDAALKQAKALGAARVLDDREWADMPVFVDAAQALDTALGGPPKEEDGDG